MYQKQATRLIFSESEMRFLVRTQLKKNPLRTCLENVIFYYFKATSNCISEVGAYPENRKLTTAELEDVKDHLTMKVPASLIVEHLRKKIKSLCTTL